MNDCPECAHPIEKHHATGGCWHTDRKNDRNLNVYCPCRRQPDGGHYPTGIYTKENT